MSTGRSTVAISSATSSRIWSAPLARPCSRVARSRKCWTRWIGLSEPNGSWKIIWTLLRYSRDARRGSLAEHVDAVDDDLSRGRPLEPGDAARDRALAAAGLTDQCQDLAALDVEVDRAERTHDRAGEEASDREVHGEASQADHGVGTASVSARVPVAGAEMLMIVLLR